MREKIKRYLVERIDLLTHHKSKSYSNRLRKQECKLLLEKLDTFEVESDGTININDKEKN